MTSVQLFLSLAGALLAWTLTVAGGAWWLSEQFKKTRHTITSSMDQRFMILDDKIGVLDDRVRAVEIKLH